MKENFWMPVAASNSIQKFKINTTACIHKYHAGYAINADYMSHSYILVCFIHNKNANMIADDMKNDEHRKKIEGGVSFVVLSI